MSKSQAAMILSLLSMAFAAVALSDDQLPLEVREAVLKSHQKWVDRMAHMEGTIRSEHKFLGQGRRVHRTTNSLFRFQLNGIFRRTDKLYEKGIVFAFSVNSKYQFLVHRAAEGTPFLLRAIDMTNQQEVGRDTLGTVEIALSSPFALHPGIHSLRDLLADRSNRAIGFEYVQNTSGEKLAILELEIGNKKCAMKKAKISLDPLNDWCIREFEGIDHNGRTEYRCTTSYEQGVKGVSYPCKVTYDYFNPSAGEDALAGETLTYELTDFAICNAPEREFTLSAFGLPEPGSVGAGESWLTGSKLLLIGAGMCVAGCGLLWFTSKRRQRSSAS